jgi:hypothetical protein
LAAYVHDPVRREAWRNGRAGVAASSQRSRLPAMETIARLALSAQIDEWLSTAIACARRARSNASPTHPLDRGAGRGVVGPRWRRRAVSDRLVAEERDPRGLPVGTTRHAPLRRSRACAAATPSVLG